MNSKAKGEISEGIILGRLLATGHSVLMPFGNNQRYDLVFENGSGLKKCQCKTGRLRNGTVTFNACSTNGFTGEKRGYRGQIDFFLVYCPDTECVYKVPVESVGQRFGYLRVTPSRYNRSRGRLASDYVL